MQMSMQMSMPMLVTTLFLLLFLQANGQTISPTTSSIINQLPTTAVVGQNGQTIQQGKPSQNGQTNAGGGPLLLKLGLLFSNATARMRTLFGFGQSAPAISLALRQAQKDGLISRGDVNISFTWYMDNCDRAAAVGFSTKLILDDDVDGIVGPPCLSSALIAGSVANFYSYPMFLWGASVGAALSDQDLYPTIVDVNADTASLALAVKKLLISFQWKEIALVYSVDIERQMCSDFQSTFEDTINDASEVTMVFKQRMEPNEQDMKNTLSLLMNRSRIIVGCFDTESNRRTFLLAINDLGIDKSNEYVFLIPQLRSTGFMRQMGTATANGTTYNYLWLDNNTTRDGRDADAKSAARLLFMIDLDNSSSQSQVDKFNADMFTETNKSPFFCDANCTVEPFVPSQYARSLYDATYLYCIALNKTIGQFGYSREAIRNATIMLNNTVGNFQGLTGQVTIDMNGSRVPIYTVTGLDAASNPAVFVGINVSGTNVTLTRKYDDGSTTIWASRGGKQPKHKPQCGYTGTECPQNLAVYIASGSGLILIFLCGTILGILLAVREKVREQRRLAQESLIPYADLRNLKEMKEEEKMKSMRSMQSSQSGSTAKVTIDSRQMETDGHAYYIYDKQIVYGKKYAVRVRLDNEDLIVLRKIRQLDHDNLNKLMGVCVDGPMLLAIWKHCQRGSLKDVIAKEQYVSDSFVMFALIRDLTNGLIALHQSFVGIHGHLTSENCLINDRWQLKISDFGLAMIHESQPVRKKKLLWTAPELLREQNRLGSQPGDVYSFAVVCSEIINKETVWNGVSREDEVEDVIYRLKRANTAIPYRPQLHPREEINQSLYHLVRDCWSESPSNRPKMELVRTLLRQMIPNSGQNLMDYVFSMLEQYANSLEQEVEERTKELVEEKRKSDILLYRMLPRQVADKLKLGESVEPESFEHATIFFSDVVSFTTLAGKCTPLQVVNLLNNLYTTFDNIIDSHDAYKVETIGDGYLVCSGIPKRNGNMHAKEIAELSFAFLRSVNNFRIDHLPGERVNLRIGFHTGPAVAGVVGLTMPRYCLFGDAVNTASRMESSGKPGQIHISTTANNYLTNVIGGYVTETRGETIIKGKGVMETYWLLGHDSEVSIGHLQHQKQQRHPKIGDPSGPMYDNYCHNVVAGSSGGGD